MVVGAYHKSLCAAARALLSSVVFGVVQVLDVVHTVSWIQLILQVCWAVCLGRRIAPLVEVTMVSRTEEIDRPGLSHTLALLTGQSLKLFEFFAVGHV